MGALIKNTLGICTEGWYALTAHSCRLLTNLTPGLGKTMRKLTQGRCETILYLPKVVIVLKFDVYLREMSLSKILGSP